MRTLFLGLVAVFCAGAAHAEKGVLSTGDCQKLVQHVPNDDVTYKPGVDVRGQPVAPADLGGGYKLDIPETIDIQIGLDLADRLGRRESPRQGIDPPVRKVMPFEGKAPLGVLSIKGNEAYWNNQRLMPQDEALLAEACSKGLTAAGVTLPTQKPQVPKQ
jgi:hypothetical protein